MSLGRNGGMELSINAIITLVIAMIVLGLGLGVVNGVLSFGGDRLAQTIDGYELYIPATSDDPIIAGNPIYLKQTGSTVVLTSAYNADNALCADDDKQVGAWPYLHCPDLSIQRIQSMPLDIPRGESKRIAMVITLESGVMSGTYPCSLHMYCDNIDDRTNDGIVSGDLDVGAIASEVLFVKVS